MPPGSRRSERRGSFGYARGTHRTDLSAERVRITTECPRAPELRRAKLGVTAVFVAHAVVFSSWAAHIPQLKAALGLSDGALGTALFGAPLGSVAATLFSHWALPRWGSRRLVPVMLAGYASAPMTVGLAGSGIWLFLTLMLWGWFQGALDVAMNTQAGTVERLARAPIMARFHGMWSVGALAGALIGAACVNVGIGLEPQLVVLGAAMLVVVGPLTLRLIARRDRGRRRGRAGADLDTDGGDSGRRGVRVVPVRGGCHRLVGQLRARRCRRRSRRVSAELCGLHPWPWCSSRQEVSRQPDHPGHGPRHLWTRTVAGRGTKGRQLSAAEVDKVRAELANYDRFAAVSEQIVEVNEAICEARPPNPAASAPSAAATGDEKKGSTSRSPRRSPPR